MRQLTALDVQFLALETESMYGHVGSLAILDPSTAPSGKLTLEDLQGFLSERAHLVPPFTLKLANVPFGLDRPYWIEDPDFDLGYHVRELAIPAPGSDEQLAEQVARIFSRRLDRDRPLWELYLIHGLPNGNVGVMSKIHHAMVDGVSGAEIMTALYDLDAKGRDMGATPERKLETEDTGALAMLGRSARGLPAYPFRALGRLPKLLPHIDVAPSLFGIPGAERISRTVSRVRRDTEVLERPRFRAPDTSFSRKISAHRRFVYGSMSLSEIKQVKKHYGVTVNDVVVALTAGATRRWLIEHDELPDTPLLAQIPVSVRTDEERGTYGNQVSIMVVPIPTHIADPVERIRAAHEALRAAKERHNALPAKALQDLTAFIPPALHARATRAALQIAGSGLLRPMMNLVISNVPGPPMPIYMAGAQLQALYPVSVIADGTGLNVTVMSYRDQVDVGIVADRQQMPDLQIVMDGLRGELADLVKRTKAAGNGKAATKVTK